MNMEYNTLAPVTTLSPHIHTHIHGPFPKFSHRVMELTGRTFLTLSFGVRTIDKRPSSTWENPVHSLNIALISKSTSKKHLE